MEPPIKGQLVLSSDAKKYCICRDLCSEVLNAKLRILRLEIKLEIVVLRVFRVLDCFYLSHTEGFPEDEFGDSSVIHMLTGWTPYTITIKPSLSASDTWDALTKLLPLWKRPEQEPQEVSDEDQDMSVVVEDPRIANGCLTLPRSDYIIIGSFGSFCFNPLHRLPTVSALEEIVSEEIQYWSFH